MTETIEARKERVRDVVCEILEIESAELTEDSLFREDHGADSMAVVEIVAWLEKEFNVKIDDSGLVRMVNVAGVYAVVSEAASWESAR